MARYEFLNSKKLTDLEKKQAMIQAVIMDWQDKIVKSIDHLQWNTEGMMKCLEGDVIKLKEARDRLKAIDRELVDLRKQFVRGWDGDLDA